MISVKKTIFIFSFYFILLGLSSQEHTHLIKVNLKGKTLGEIQSTGLAFDHGQYVQGESFIGDFSHEELAKLKSKGFEVEPVLKEIQALPVPVNHCNPDTAKSAYYYTPSNYSIGSMNGYLNLEELYENLDLMVELYPQLITRKKAIGNFYTEEGRPIFYLKISDNPNIEESEPQILYTSLHHAREPISMSQMLFYMWYLLENYRINPEVKKLVDSREMFFVPCVNPDGYKFNQTTNPSGNGYWRKNRSENDLGYGVDLNRNYSLQWGYNNIGSSDKGDSDTYRGDQPFSEPEVQAIRDLCRKNKFSIAMNYHSFGNFLLIPWGYDDLPLQDQRQYDILASDFTQFNKFKVGNAINTLNYQANGISDDWMYGDSITKNKIFAFTPEVGEDFWPERSEILRINQSTQYMNFAAAWNAGAVVKMAEVSSQAIESENSKLIIKLSRTGIQSEDIHIVCTSNLGSQIQILNPNSLRLNPTESKLIAVDYKLNSPLPIGTKIEFTITLTTGEYSEVKTITKTYLGSTYWKDECNHLNYWTLNSNQALQTTNSDYFSQPSCFTDSPNGPITENKLLSMSTVEKIDLSNSTYAYLSYNIKYDLNRENDFAQVLISNDGLQYNPICGKYSVPGGLFQGIDQPVYAGLQDQWVNEWIDLKQFLGDKINLQLRVGTSVGEQQHDGFYIDDIKVYTDLVSLTKNNTNTNISVYYNAINNQLIISDPADNINSVGLTQLCGSEVELKYSKSNGRIMAQLAIPSGIYLVTTIDQQNIKRTEKIFVP